MATPQEQGPFQMSIDRLRGELDRMVEMARDRGGKALDAVGIKPPMAAMFPATDIYETNDAVHLVVNLPGISAEALDLNVTGQILHIRGSVQKEPQDQSGAARLSERHTGAFDRAFPLPCAINAESTQANLTHGVLRVRLPKVANEVGYNIPIGKDDTSPSYSPVVTSPSGE